MVFNIQRYSTHDGQGIRTLVFYKGCPLCCKWCCNPESQSFGFDLMYDSRLCKKFGDCLLVGNVVSKNNEEITIDRTGKHPLGSFRHLCATGALALCGEEKTPEEILAEIEKDLPFYTRSGGGVTLTGGEPLAQGEELDRLLGLLHARQIPVNIETTLCVPWSAIARCVGFADTFLADIKHTDAQKLEFFTGANLALIVDNLAKLVATGSRIIFRVPVIPGFNHTRTEMNAIIELAASLIPGGEIHFLPYHALGEAKYKMIGREYTFSGIAGVGEDELTPYLQMALDKGLIAKTGG